MPALRLLPVVGALLVAGSVALVTAQPSIASGDPERRDVQTRIIGGTPAPAPTAPGGWPYQTEMIEALESGEGFPGREAEVHAGLL